MLARPELLQQPHVPIEETGQTRGIAWHQTAVNDRTVLVLVADRQCQISDPRNAKSCSDRLHCIRANA